MRYTRWVEGKRKLLGYIQDVFNLPNVKSDITEKMSNPVCKLVHCVRGVRNKGEIVNISIYYNMRTVEKHRKSSYGQYSLDRNITKK